LAKLLLGDTVDAYAFGKSSVGRVQRDRAPENSLRQTPIVSAWRSVEIDGAVVTIAA
jgi:hypothetical protein